MKIIFCLLIIGLVFFLKPNPQKLTEPVVVKIETKKPIENLEFEYFSDSELTEYNLLVWKRAEAIKSRIFRKYFNKYGKAVI